MQDASAALFSDISPIAPGPVEDKAEDTVSTHVLVAEEQVSRLRELSKKTRIAQSEYLREAVQDLLTKYCDGDKQES